MMYRSISSFAPGPKGLREALIHSRPLLPLAHTARPSIPPSIVRGGVLLGETAPPQMMSFYVMDCGESLKALYCS